MKECDSSRLLLLHLHRFGSISKLQASLTIVSVWLKNTSSRAERNRYAGILRPLLENDGIQAQLQEEDYPELVRGMIRMNKARRKQHLQDDPENKLETKHVEAGGKNLRVAYTAPKTQADVLL
jgi:hypothetical protein